jgi:hypothetical protein
MTTRSPRIIAALTVMTCAAACTAAPSASPSSGSSSRPSSRSSAGSSVVAASGAPSLHPLPSASSFVDVIDNPWMPWPVGTTWRFIGRSAQGTERTVVTVTDRKRVVDGVRATVVRDVVHVDGRLLEDTDDWYAQDSDGNVWYLGEDTKEYDRSGKANTYGSWEAGVNGAKPGIVMLARPVPGASYRQEYLRGQAEDQAKVLGFHGSATVPVGHLHGLLRTYESSRLEPKADEDKYYERGVGVVLEQSLHEKDRTELVSMTPAP